MQKRIIPVIFTFLINILLAQNPNKQIQSTVNKIYNFNFEKANLELDAFSVRYPDDHLGYYYKSLMNLWFYLGSLNETYKDSFDYYSDIAKTILERNNSDKHSEIVKKLFWLGMIEYNKSVSSARANDFTSAILSLKNMRDRLDEAIRLNPEFYDAYLPIGLSNFAFAEVPAALKWAANLVGFNSDKELGLEYLKLVFDKGIILKTDAQFYLSQIYSRVIIEYQEADKILSKLVKAYPKNLLFNYSAAWLKYQMNELNSSEKIFRNILSSNDKIFSYVISNSHLMLANIFFAREQYDSALVHYNLFRDNRVNYDYLGFANLRTGICYELLGNRNQAIKYYEKSDEGNKDLDEDIYAERMGKLFASKPINDEFKFILHIRNLIKQKKLKDAEENLKNALDEIKYSNSIKSELYLLLGNIYLLNEKFEDALEYSLQSVKLNASKDYTIAANSYYNAAVASVNLNREDEAIYYLDKIEQTDELDFQTLLKNKAYSLRRKIVEAGD